MEQLALSFQSPQPHASLDDVAALMEMLRGRGWMKASEISEITATCGAGPVWSDRKIRAIASESGGRILSSDKGYKLTTDCTPEEERHARERLLSQAKQMQQRAVDIAKVFHQSA